MKSPVRIVLIGCGRAAELIYLPVLNKLQDVNVVAVIDPIEERRKIVSEKFKDCFSLSNLSPELIDQIDAGIICTPPNTHITLSSVFLKKNKYILVEKPLAESMDGIKNLIDTESFSKASLMMGFNHRYWQPVIDLKKKLSEKVKIKSMEINFTSNYTNWNPVSFVSNPLDDLGPHLFDLVRFIFNKEIISVSVNSLHVNNLELIIEVTGNFFINCIIAHSNKTIKTIRVMCESEEFFITLSSERIYPGPGNKRKLLDLNDKIKRKLLKKISPIKTTYEVQLNNFINFIKSNKPAEPDINDGVSAILIVEAVRKSIKNKRKFYIDEIKSC